jgi:hypothetical protein
MQNKEFIITKGFTVILIKFILKSRFSSYRFENNLIINLKNDFTIMEKLKFKNNLF